MVKLPRKKGKYGRGKTIYQFNVGEKTLELYQKEVRNTRAKLNRVLREHEIDLSNDINIPSLESFSSRKELNQWVRNVQSFRNRANRHYQFVKNEYGVSASKSRLDKIEKLNKKAQKLADEQIQKYEDKPFISGGKEQGTVGMQRPNKTGIYRPKDFNFSEVRSEQRLREIEQAMGEKSVPLYYDERMERMKTNFIEALSGSFNSLADGLIGEIKNLNADVFYQLYLEFDEFDFDYFDTDGQSVVADESSIGQMLRAIDKYKEGRLDTDLWHENFN